MQSSENPHDILRIVPTDKRPPTPYNQEVVVKEGDREAMEREHLIKLFIVEERTRAMDEKLSDISHQLRKEFVRRDEFEAIIEPIKRLTYGAVALLLTAILGGIVKFVFFPV